MKNGGFFPNNMQVLPNIMGVSKNIRGNASLPGSKQGMRQT
jgi:hypothetical protein